MLAQDELTLIFGDFSAHVLPDLTFEFQHADFFLEDGMHEPQTLGDFPKLQHLLLSSRHEIQGGGHDVGQQARTLGVHGPDIRLVGGGFVQIHHLMEEFKSLWHQLTSFIRRFVQFLDDPSERADEGVFRNRRDGTDSPQALREHAGRAVRQLEHPCDLGLGADLVKIAEGHGLGVGIVLTENEHVAIEAQRLFDRREGLLAADHKRVHGVGNREEGFAAQGEYRQLDFNEAIVRPGWVCVRLRRNGFGCPAMDVGLYHGLRH